jgi:hypothetical protein
MACILPRPIFASPLDQGINVVTSLGDGKSIKLDYSQAYAGQYSNFSVAYNIYFSTILEDVFIEGPKYVTEEIESIISQFSPNDRMHFAVRAMLWNPLDMDITRLPQASDLAPNCYFYPESFLSSTISDTDTQIPIYDATDFPPFGVISIGTEAIIYYSVDYGSNILHTTPAGRGQYSSIAVQHIADGYVPTLVKFYKGYEEDNESIISIDPDFYKPNYAYTEADGYKQVTKDILTTNLSSSDDSNALLSSYDYTGYHQTSILDYFSGKCIGSYAGGEYGCADGSGKFHTKVRGLNIQETNLQREELLLNTTGEPIVLLRRMWTGIRCNCFRSNYESPEARCPQCFSVGFVGGYEQYFNPKRSDRRILVRFEPSNDDLAYKNRGLEQNFLPNAWTTVIPAIKDRDILIRFNEDGTEEYRYEILNVTRNKLLFSLSGAQKFQLHRIDKTDIIYQWRALRDAAKLPSEMYTATSVLAGHGPHVHKIVINEAITSISQINQTTGVSAGHAHTIINGVLQNVLGHTHDIILV